MFSTPTANTMMSNTWENREIIFIVMLFFIDYLCAPPPPAMTSSLVQLFDAKQLPICASALFEQASEQALSVSLQSVFGGVPGGHVIGTYGQASIHPCKLKASAHSRKAGMLQEALGGVLGLGFVFGVSAGFPGTMSPNISSKESGQPLISRFPARDSSYPSDLNLSRSQFTISKRSCANFCFFPKFCSLPTISKRLLTIDSDCSLKIVDSFKASLPSGRAIRSSAAAPAFRLRTQSVL